MSDDSTIKIIRAPKDRDIPYFSMAKEAAQDKRLSWEARGVLAYLLSKPGNWAVRVKNLEREQCKRTRVRRILRELRTAGYAEIVHEQDPNTGKITATYYRIYATPELAKTMCASDPRDGFTPPDGFNAPLQIEERTQIKESTQTEMSAKPTLAQCDELLDAFDAALPGIHKKIERNAGNRFLAQALLQARFTPAQIAEHTKILCTRPEWKRGITLGKLKAILLLEENPPDCAASPLSGTVTPRPRNDWYDAVFDVWGFAGGRNTNYAKMLQGIATTKGYKEHNLEHPLTDSQQLRDWAGHWKQKHPGLTLVSSPEKVQSDITAWQQNGSKPKRPHGYSEKGEEQSRIADEAILRQAALAGLNFYRYVELPIEEQRKYIKLDMEAHPDEYRK